VNRRNFIRKLGVASAGFALGPGLFADEAPTTLGRIAYQLSWIKNFQFAGDYIADNKSYYQKFGLEGVDLLAGGPGIIVDPIVVSGKALIGQSAPDFMANAIAHGADLKCVGAGYQRGVDCIISLTKTPLVTPRDMIGKRIGIQIINIVIWHAFLKLNNIAPASITTVPVQFDFTPLLSGEVDGFFGETTDDVTDLQAQGHAVHPLLFTDFGYKMFSATYSVRTDSLSDKTKRAQLVAFMKASALGWNDAIKDPALGAKLTVDVYGNGNGLNPEIEEKSCLAVNPFMTNADTAAHGLFWMSPASVAETITTLAAAGVKATPDMFTNEILEEAYGRKTIL
jgi:ABC-type nitrate/sulfonate/bicarbonate transport system substrate-binding protein